MFFWWNCTNIYWTLSQNPHSDASFPLSTPHILKDTSVFPAQPEDFIATYKANSKRQYATPVRGMFCLFMLCLLWFHKSVFFFFVWVCFCHLFCQVLTCSCSFLLFFFWLLFCDKLLYAKISFGLPPPLLEWWMRWCKSDWPGLFCFINYPILPPPPRRQLLRQQRASKRTVAPIMCNLWGGGGVMAVIRYIIQYL